MSDLISRQDAIDLFLDEGMITAAIYIDHIPSAQPEQKTGQWIAENSRPKSSIFYCSICHRTCYDIQPNRQAGWKKRCRYTYCPFCGAKMEVEHE